MIDRKFNQLAGMFYGFAIGDALGTTLEFKPRDSYVHMDDMVGGGTFRLKAGQWTDDTSMMLAACETITGDRAFKPRRLMDELCAWTAGRRHVHERGCFDIGSGTSAIVSDYARTKRLRPASTRSGGNGVLCRVIPFVSKHLNDPASVVAGSVAQARVTNGDEASIRAAALYAKVLWNAVRSPAGAPMPQLGRFYDGVARDDISSSGYAPTTLDAALWAVQTSDTFVEAVLKACNLGWDSDSVGAVAGALAGARWGYDAIPQEWLAKLVEPEMLDAALDGVLPIAAAPSAAYYRKRYRQYARLLPTLSNARAADSFRKGRPVIDRAAPAAKSVFFDHIGTDGDWDDAIASYFDRAELADA
jgi:ADP-ribosyl-[dinitrogen reductase] hydrolase